LGASATATAAYALGSAATAGAAVGTMITRAPKKRTYANRVRKQAR